MDMSEIEKLERAKVGTIKLSEAIRIGAKLRPQHFGMMDRDSVDGRSCALGAAEEALTGFYPLAGVPSSIFIDNFRSRFPGVLMDEVWKRNDFQKMSRESIADWLEGQGY